MTSRGWAMGALVLAGLAGLAGRAAATTRIPQYMDKNLLNIIKHKLRRNNDDYSDRLPNDDPPPAGPRAARRDTFRLNDIQELNESKHNTRGGSVAGDDTSPTLIVLKSRPVQPTPRLLASTVPVVQRKFFSTVTARRHVAGSVPRTRSSPPADILDMAPAKGNRINAKREKGRLCQRHVLLPEGPKYDAWGTAYLLAHSGRRPFPSTRAPRLLLPACCNCCKKSALGCE